jgi:CubicO group peptidase (beta-lactamase class C family)
VKFKAGILAAVALGLVGSSIGAQTRLVADPDVTARVDAVFKDFDSRSSPGCALAVYQDDRVVYQRAYGMANLDHDVPLTTSSVFHVASVSKQFTAASILLLAQEGKLSLDDEVRKHLREFPDFGHRITIRHLLHHTSGVRDQWSLLGLAGWRYSRDLITDGDVLELLSRQRELNFAPGQRYLYSNSGYTLLAIIVSRVSGQSFRAFTTQRIFEPLGMTNTHFRDEFREVVKQQAYGYERAGGTFRLSVTNFDTAGATSLMTTVEDLARWNANFEKPVVGGSSLLSALLQRGTIANGSPIDYASGITHGTYRGLSTVGHGGSDAGYRADFVRFPAEHVGIACLCNLASANPGELARRVADVYLAGVLKPVPAQPARDEPEVALNSTELESYAGTYWNEAEAAAVRVVVQEGALAARPVGGAQLRLRPIGGGRFVPASGDGPRLAFETDRATSTSRLTVGNSPSTVYTRTAPFNPLTLDEFAGVYRSDELDAVYRVVLRNGLLTLERSKSSPVRLEPLITDTFGGQPGTFRFVRDGGGRVNGFLLEAGRVRGVRFRKE